LCSVHQSRRRLSQQPAGTGPYKQPPPTEANTKRTLVIKNPTVASFAVKLATLLGYDRNKAIANSQARHIYHSQIRDLENEQSDFWHTSKVNPGK
jgi:hypothetical protein